MTDYHSVFNINVIETCTNYCRVTYYFKCSPATACIDKNFTWKLTFYGRVLKSIAYVTLVHKAADEIRITIFFKSFGIKKTNELVVTSNKLTNKFAGLVISGLGPDVARSPPV
jgi:hypothetical protein